MKALLDEEPQKDTASNINTCTNNELGIPPAKSSNQPEDCARRLRFANFVVNEWTEADHTNFVFSDEATFSYDEEVNP